MKLSYFATTRVVVQEAEPAELKPADQKVRNYEKNHRFINTSCTCY